MPAIFAGCDEIFRRGDVGLKLSRDKSDGRRGQEIVMRSWNFTDVEERYGGGFSCLRTPTGLNSAASSIGSLRTNPSSHT